MEVLFVKTDEMAKLPKKNDPSPTVGDIGYDLFATKTTMIPANGSAIVPIGLKIGYITPGYWLKIENRSGNGFKKNLRVHPGVIDNSYRGELGIKVWNLSNQHQTIEAGNGVAQFIVNEMIVSDVAFTDNVSEAKRGERGFGSSDKKS